MSAWLLSLLLASAQAAAPKSSSSCEGGSFKLTVSVIRAAQYDGADGVSKAEVWSGGKKLKALALPPGEWRCLAYSQPRKAFVLGGSLQKGYTMPVNKLRFLSEPDWSSSAARSSSLWGDEGAGTRADNGFAALAAVPSRDGRYVAFIGSLGEENGALFAFDTVEDAFAVLGDPPAPPPGTADGIAKEAHFDWTGGGPSDGFIPLDAGILLFPVPGVLRASYGADSVKARAKKRTTKDWDLAQAFAERIHVFRCPGGAELSARFSPEKVSLTLPGRAVELPRMLSASGARYSDGHLVFWNKGSEATVYEGEKMLHAGCVTP
jgi:membrane-bound inhibitor of C-type lysozyme